MQLTAEITELVTCGSITFHAISVLRQAMTDNSEKQVKVVTEAEYHVNIMLLSLGFVVVSLVKALCV